MDSCNADGRGCGTCGSKPCRRRGRAEGWPAGVSVWWLTLTLAGCAANTSQQDVATGPPPSQEEQPSRAQRETPQAVTPDAPDLPQIKTVRQANGRLAIRREDLKRLVGHGANRFIQLVDVRPTFRKRRFAGWQIVEYKGPGQLESGDVVVSINRQSIERPEQFMAVWNAAPTRKQLEIVLLRRGRKVKLNFPLVP